MRFGNCGGGVSELQDLLIISKPGSKRLPGLLVEGRGLEKWELGVDKAK